MQKWPQRESDERVPYRCQSELPFSFKVCSPKGTGSLKKFALTLYQKGLMEVSGRSSGQGWVVAQERREGSKDTLGDEAERMCYVLHVGNEKKVESG